MVLCPNCDQWFASAIQMDAETWEGIRMATGLMERCAHCGVATRFAKGEYQFRSD
jgi:bacterioferritin-associated ferredoxin